MTDNLVFRIINEFEISNHIASHFALINSLHKINCLKTNVIENKNHFINLFGILLILIKTPYNFKAKLITGCSMVKSAQLCRW